MIYEPSEDSYLILKNIKEYACGKKVLDMGTGSGILAKEAEKYAREITASDINEECALEGIKFIRSDLFENIKDKYDLIIFNPPYLPRDNCEDKSSAVTTTGGKNGYEVIAKFLSQAGNHLFPKGKMLIVFSSLTGKAKVNSLIHQNDFEFNLLESAKIDFETLYCCLIYRR